MSVEVVAELKLVEGREEEGLEALRQAVEATHEKDAGCMIYALHRDLADPTHLVMVEKWESADDLAAHSRTEHLAALGGHPALDGAPRVLVLEGLGFGDEKGAL
jgi:quinol monooxygenase YgiN